MDRAADGRSLSIRQRTKISATRSRSDLWERVPDTSRTVRHQRSPQCSKVSMATRVRRVRHRIDPPEMPDHVIIFDEASLRRTLRSYFRYYHESRLHLSLDKDSPNSRPVQSVGKVIGISEVGGLHHRYQRRAA